MPLKTKHQQQTGPLREESRCTPGSFLGHVSNVEVFLEILTDTTLEFYHSHDAVLDLFNFCIVLYVRNIYFLELYFLQS